ncbi:hypothetical protein ACSQ67_021902 [Phaseolus vulgaris]
MTDSLSLSLSPLPHSAAFFSPAIFSAPAPPSTVDHFEPHPPIYPKNNHEESTEAKPQTRSYPRYKLSSQAKSLKVLYGTLLKALMPTEIPAAEPKGMDMHKGYNSINGLVVAWFLLCNNPGSYYNPPPFAYGFMHSFL